MARRNISYYRRKLERQPENPLAHVRYAEACLREGEAPAARASFTAAARIFLAAGFDKKARAALDRAQAVADAPRVPEERSLAAALVHVGPVPARELDDTVQITGVFDLGTIQSEVERRHSRTRTDPLLEQMMADTEEVELPFDPAAEAAATAQSA